MKNLISLYLGTLLLIMSCEKGKDDGVSDVIIFNGITNTNIEGEPISQDTTDWNLNEDWNAKENSLFLTKMDVNCSTDNFNYSIISYPNPCHGIFYIHLSKPEEILLSIRIVDKEYNVLISKDTINSTTGFDLNDFNVQNDTIRIYYKFTGENCELKGHGDIKVE